MVSRVPWGFLTCSLRICPSFFHSFKCTLGFFEVLFPILSLVLHGFKCTLGFFDMLSSNFQVSLSDSSLYWLSWRLEDEKI